MNHCIINVVEKSIFVAFNEIVDQGYITVWKLNGKEKPIIKKEIINTNFQNINLDNGKYRVEIDIDGQQIIKTININ